MSSLQIRPPDTKTRRPARRILSRGDDGRSVRAGVILTLILWPLMVFLFGKAINHIGGEHEMVLPARKSPPSFNIELAPEQFTPPPQQQPKIPPKFVETNPNAPENVPDKSNNFGAQNQQAAQETPTPAGKSDRPATEGKKDFESSQIVDGELTPPQEAPPPAPPPTPEVAQALQAAAAARKAENPLPGQEKIEGESPEGLGTNIAEQSETPTAVPKKVEGQKDAPLTVGNPAPSQPRIDPSKPQPRIRLPQQRSRPAILADNKFGTQNIGVPAWDARWSNYGAYLQRLLDSVQVQFDKLVVESRIYPPTGTVVTVKFRLEAVEGAIAEIIDVHSTGGEQAALICKTAIVSRAPYGKWTDDMVATLGMSQEMTFTFYYGM